MNKESDGRRKLTYKRRIDSLEQDRALLIRLMENLRLSDESEVNRIIRAIRNGASLVEMDVVLAAASGSGQPPRTPKTQYISNPDDRGSDHGESDKWTSNNGTSGARKTYLGLSQLCS